MQFSQFHYLALDIARERTLEAERYHRFAQALRGPAGPGVARRSLARAAAGGSRALASVARRLDSGPIEPEALGRGTPA